MKTKLYWNNALADLCVNDLKLSECRVSLTEEEEEGEKSIFDRVCFSMKTALLEGAVMYTGSISHVDNDIEA